jgi:hypothetical protein
MERFDTKTTRLGNNLYGCRIINTQTGTWIVEAQVKKQEIPAAFAELLRTLDKCGYDSPMASASRNRAKNTPLQSIKFIWNNQT